METYEWIDILAVGRAIGVAERSFIPPIPGETRMVTVQSWDGEALERAIAYLAPHKQTGGTVVIWGHVDAWIIVALANSLRPECTVLYGAGLNGPGTDPVPTEFLQLETGEKNPALRFDYTMRVEGDNCYMEYRVDDPNAPVGVVHTFRNEDLPKLVLPPVPADKNLFLYAHASYYVQVNVTSSYTRYAKSVSTAYLEATEYHCAYSSTPELRVGAATPKAVSA